MYEIIEKILDMAADFINTIFMFKVDWNGTDIVIGKIVVPFIFIALSIYLILDALGILGGDE